ncbi:MAG: DUF2085 domain-containing protein [Melioribacteraceae bacterium]|nr:DUF2085 domain-containing protein [Melioribacteraceae bacterium]
MKNVYKVLFTSVAFLWLVGTLLSLIDFTQNIFIEFIPFLYIFYSPVCHQNVDKLICVDNSCSLLCSRCVGIYLGVFITSITLIFIAPKNIIPIKYLFILSIPLLLDVIFVSLGIYNYSKLIALFTGFIFGSAAFYYFYNGIEIFLYEKRINK